MYHRISIIHAIPLSATLCSLLYFPRPRTIKVASTSDRNTSSHLTMLFEKVINPPPPPKKEFRAKNPPPPPHQQPTPQRRRRPQSPITKLPKTRVLFFKKQFKPREWRRDKSPPLVLSATIHSALSNIAQIAPLLPSVFYTLPYPIIPPPSRPSSWG